VLRNPSVAPRANAFASLPAKAYEVTFISGSALIRRVASYLALRVLNITSVSVLILLL
jgi:hypothetical protein